MLTIDSICHLIQINLQAALNLIQCYAPSRTLNSGERVVVSFGPQRAALDQRQVGHAMREAGELFPLPKMKGVTSKGGFGVWCWDIAFKEAQIHDIIEKHAGK